MLIFGGASSEMKWSEATEDFLSSLGFALNDSE